MGEQSHKTEMAAALRGDFERLRRRRGDAVALDVTGSVAPTQDEPAPPTPPVPPAVAEPEPDQPSVFGRLFRR